MLKISVHNVLSPILLCKLNNMSQFRNAIGKAFHKGGEIDLHSFYDVIMKMH